MSCSKSTNKSVEKESLTDIDSLSLLDLEKQYSKTGDITDLRAYLQQIDVMLAKDSNTLTYNNINLIKLKLSLLNFNNNDSINISLMDSLNQRVLHFYKKMVISYPYCPRVYFDLGQEYYSPQANNIDSAHFYFERSLFICDSTLLENPYNEKAYSLKVYTLLVLGRETEIKSMIEKDKILMKDNEEILKFLQKLSKELNI